LLDTVGEPGPWPYTLKITGPYSGAFDISEPDVNSRDNKIVVYMEGLYLRNWGAKHILLDTLGDLAPSSVPCKFQASIQGPSIFPSPMFIQDIIK
jgi:hypothetical protein